MEKMDKQEWLNWRFGGVGSSDAPIVMEVSPWKTPYQLYLQKLNRTEDESSRAKERGKILEPKALAYFANKIGVELQSQVCTTHASNAWMRSTLDGINFDKKVVVEVKCPNKEDHQLAVSGKIPEKYYPQLQHQLETTGFEMLYYFSFDGEEGVIVEVGRDQKYIDSLVGEERKFWDCVLNMTPPPLCDRDYETKDEEWASKAEKLWSLGEQIKMLEKEYEEYKKELVLLSSDRHCKGGGYKFTRIERAGGIDYSAIPELTNINLELYRKKPTIQWRLSAIK